MQTEIEWGERDHMPRFAGHAEAELRRYTAYVRFPSGDIEEIDTDAINTDEARRLTRKILDSDYLPGGFITDCIERFGFYL